MSLANLVAARESLEAKIAATYAVPDDQFLMDYSVDGRSFSHTGHRASLQKELDDLNEMILKRTGAVEISTIALG